MAKSRLRSVLRPVAAALLVIGATWGSARFVWELHGPEAPRDDGPPAVPGARHPAPVGWTARGGNVPQPAPLAAPPAPMQLHCTVVRVPGGDPVAGARLDLRAVDGGVVARGETDAGGVVVLALPAGAAGRLSARVEAPGIFPVPVEGDDVAPSAGGRVVIAVAAAHRVTLRCIDAGTGAAVAGARAVLVPSTAPVGESDASGLLGADLPAPGAVLRTEARGFLPDERRVVPRGSAAESSVVVELVRAASFAPWTARIVRADGKPVADAPIRVEVRRLPGGRATRRTLAAATEGLAGRTDVDGRISVTFRAAGVYDVIVEQGERPPFVRTITFDGQGGGVPEEIRLPPEWIVAGRIVSHDGAPVAGAELTVSAGGRTQRMPVSGDGSFRGFIAAEAGPVVLEAVAAERPVAVLEVARPEDLAADARIVLGVGGTLRGRVIGPDGAPAVACRVVVSVSTAGRRKPHIRTVVTDDQGRFAATGLPPGGRLTVTATPAEGGPGSAVESRGRARRLLEGDNPVAEHGEERDLGDLSVLPR